VASGDSAAALKARADRETAEAAKALGKSAERIERARTDVELAKLGLRRQWVTGKIVPVRGSSRARPYRRRPKGQGTAAKAARSRRPYQRRSHRRRR
jgi:hypothetical protein